MIPWARTFGEAIIGSFMFGLPMWIFSMPWVFAANYLLMKEILRNKE
jgi:hypothetical protein